MWFSWDSKKAASNKTKHGLSLERAITAFDDPFALIAPDEKHSVSELREWLIGESDFGVVVVVFTRRQNGQEWRVVSARRANKKERMRYEEYKRISL